jgi:hypothetical protein
MRRYHHIGIPTTERRDVERLIEGYTTYVSGCETSAYGTKGSPTLIPNHSIPHFPM